MCVCVCVCVCVRACVRACVCELGKSLTLKILASFISIHQHTERYPTAVKCHTPY